MVTTTGHEMAVANDPELQRQNTLLFETLDRYGVDPQRQMGADLFQVNQRLRQILRETWERIWRVDR